MDQIESDHVDPPSRSRKRCLPEQGGRSTSPNPQRFSIPRLSESHTSATEIPFGLKVLFCGNQPIVDLVAVHGLDGHREDTWTADNGVLWLRDELPKEIPNIRVLSYGYDARTYGSSPLSCQTIHDHAVDLIANLSLERRKNKIPKRPIIFVAHGLGGIIVKSGLIHSNSTGEGNLEDHKAIKLSTYGILFFGTPHQGTDGFLRGKAFANIDSLSTYTSDIVLKDLGKDSEWLQQQLWQYTRISKGFVTKFFYETYQTSHEFSRKVVVPKSSAVVPGETNTEVFAINSDHLNMVRYESADDDGFQRAASCIGLMVEDAPKKVSENWHRWEIKAAGNNDSQIPFRVPFQLDYHRNPSFTGRESLLDQLDTEIRTRKSRVVVLHGTGGMGKTQIALEYVYTHQMRYTSIFWINAASEETTNLGFREAAERLINHHATIIDSKPDYPRIAQLIGMHGVVDENGQISMEKEVAQRVVEGMKQWFSRPENPSWLLVFDNVDDLESFNINSFIPHIQGTIIMTSRRPECAGLGKGLEVGEMLEKEGLALLTKSACKVDQLNSEDKENAKHIAKKLGYLPLALDQAGAYIASRRLSFGGYAKIYEKNFRKIFSENPKNPAWSYRDQTVFTTWEISFEAIERENKEAAELLLLCSFLSNEDIWENMLRRGQKLEEDDTSLGDSLHLLFSYSLVQRKGVDDSFYIHPLVHEWARERLTLQGHLCKAKEAVALVGRSVAYSGRRTRDLWEFEARILVHIHIVCSNIEKYLKSEIKASAEIGWLNSVLWIASTYNSQGWWKEAEELEVQVLEAKERVLGKEHPETLTSMANLALAYWSQGRWKEAEELGVQVLEAMERVLGKEHPGTLTSMANLASTYWSQGQGRWKEAEELGVQVLEAEERVLGKEHPGTLTSMANLALTYWSQGRWKEAEELGVQVLEARERVLGKEHPETLTSMANLTLTYRNQGRWKEAEELGVQVLEAEERVLGKEHPGTLTSMANLALTYRSQGRWKEAEELGVQVLEARERVLGKEHPGTLTSMANLASTYQNQGRWKEAEELGVQVLEAEERVLGGEHPETLTSMANLASTYRSQGRWKEAEELGVQVLEARERVLDKEHPETLTSMANLALTYRNQGRWKEAEELGVQVLEAEERVLGKEHPDTLTSMANLASTYWDQGRWKEAEELGVQVLEAMERVLGKEHPGTLTSMANLVSIYWSQGQGRWKEAEELQVQVLEAEERVLGKEHPETLTSMANLASIYWSQGQGRWKEAEELQVQVLEAEERVLGKEHPETLTSMANLALTYRSQGRWEEAKELEMRESEIRSQKLLATTVPVNLT